GANDREVKSNLPNPARKWDLPAPPPPKAAGPKGPPPKGPPALQGKIEGDGAAGTLALAPLPSQQGYVEAKLGEMTGRARIRVAAQLPYTQDFEKIPPGAAPGGWVNVQAKFTVAKLPTGETVLSKVNTDSHPPFARANGYITLPSASNYTIQAEVFGTEVGGRMPDIGLVNSRYTLILDGKANSE